MKYEVDKTSGYLRLDRPQRTSATPPTLYGFIPRMHCDVRVAKLSRGATRGDGDPLDICVLSERPVVHNEIIVPARVIGGLELNDGGEADDKIIAVIENDHV
jgi:inorganic pyrophosphatase